MTGHIEGTINDFPEEVSKPKTNPASEYIFAMSSTSQELNSERLKIRHSVFTKLLFISRRTILDIQALIDFT